MNENFIRFKAYIDEWEKLDRDYNEILPIPFYQFFKQMQILNKKQKLTNYYSKFIN